MPFYHNLSLAVFLRSHPELLSNLDAWQPVWPGSLPICIGIALAVVQPGVQARAASHQGTSLAS